MRLTNVPKAELRQVLGLSDWHCADDDEWVRVVVWESVADANGRPVPDCVFVNTETGLVVVRDLTPGAYPLRCENRPAPLTVRGAP